MNINFIRKYGRFDCINIEKGNLDFLLFLRRLLNFFKIKY